MADKEEASSGGVDNTSRGTDWEVVSLTASAYAASPGPKPVVDDVTPYEAQTSHPLYMSRHFMVEEHHNHMATESSDDKASKKVDHDFSLEQETPGKQDGGDLSLKKLDSAKGEVEFASGLDFLEAGEKGKTEEDKIYKTAMTSLEDERAFGGSHVYEQNEPVHEQSDPDVSPELDPSKDDDKHHEVANVPPPPSEAWWKRSAASLISQAKETNTVWSIFIAAAVMGVVVLGQRWQHERWHILQLKWESSIANEKAGRLMGPISRLKQAFVGGQRRDSFIRVSSQNDS